MRQSILALLSIVFITACAPELPPIIEETLAPPLQRVMQRGNRLVFHPLNTSAWGELVELGDFGDFRPDLTLEQTIRCVGPPDERPGETSGIFEVEAGRVGVFLQTQGSTFGTARFWRLRLYPANPSYDEFFHPEISRQIDQRVRAGEERVDVVVMAPDGPGITVQLWMGKIEHVTWHTVTGTGLSLGCEAKRKASQGHT